MNFEEQVRQELKGLNQEEIVQFAWRCAVRALPILGHQGHFDFWKENKQRHLYSVFRAIDADAADAYADAAYAAYADAVRAARRLNIDLEPIILKDLQQIRAEGGGGKYPYLLMVLYGGNSRQLCRRQAVTTGEVGMSSCLKTIFNLTKPR